MNSLKEDLILLNWRPDKIKEFREMTSPYVWRLRLSEKDFEDLENAINDSVKAHEGKDDHLFEDAFVSYIIIYIAEWYKRRYEGNGPSQRSPKVTLNNCKQLWIKSGYDINIFVYRTTDDDNSPHLWQQSMFVLGGLPVHHELMRGNDNSLLKNLCCIMYGEEIPVEELGDSSRAIAINKSLSEKHSLFYYMYAILGASVDSASDPEEKPFAECDLDNPNSEVSLFLEDIKAANREAVKDKYYTEWLITHAPYYQDMSRLQKVSLRPEQFGGQLRQYLGYDRLRRYWHIANPETIKRIAISIQFKDRDEIVKEADFSNPILIYSNTFKESTGFVKWGSDDDYVLFPNLPSCHFTTAEMVLKADDNAPVVIPPASIYPEYMQVYRSSQNAEKWTSRKLPHTDTAVVYSNKCKIVSPETISLDIEQKVFHDPITGDSEPYFWCQIYDSLVIEDESGRAHTLLNQSGYYQVIAQLFTDEIDYTDTGFVRHCFIEDAEEYEDEELDESMMEEEFLPLLFGLKNLHVRKSESRKEDPQEIIPESISLKVGYRDWKEIQSSLDLPFGAITLRVVVDGLPINYKAFHIPFEGDKPIVRNFEAKQIELKFNDSIISDDYEKNGKEYSATITQKIGNKYDYIELPCYRAIIGKEVYVNNMIVEYADNHEDIEIPIICCKNFKVRSFTAEGVSIYECDKLEKAWNQYDLKRALLEEKRLLRKISVEGLPNSIKAYLFNKIVASEALYAWDGIHQPIPISSVTEAKGKTVIQSLCDAPDTRHYCAVVGKNDISPFGAIANPASPFQCYKWAVEYGSYFFLFKPLRMIAAEGRIENEIVHPLIIERGGVLKEKDWVELRRLAKEFNYVLNINR